jgi:hypothetical protein
MRKGHIVSVVSDGTTRNEDLIPAFVSALDDLLEDASFLPGADDPESVADLDAVQTRLGHIDRRIQEGDRYFTSDDANHDIQWLFDALNAYAPDGFWFGAHDGDGALFGFWTDEDGDA